MSGRIEAAVRPSLERFDQERAEQREVAGWFELFSPALLTHRLLADAAQSGEASHTVFRAASIDYHRQVRETLLTAGLGGAEFTPADLKRIPRFSAPAAPGTGAEKVPTKFAGIGGAIGLLFAAAGLVGFAGFHRLSRQGTPVDSEPSG